MDCCGQSKPKEADKNIKTGNAGEEVEVKASNTGRENNQAGHGCCGGSGSGMWLHLIIMLIVIVAFWFFGKK